MPGGGFDFFNFLKDNGSWDSEFAERWRTGDPNFLGMPRGPATGNAVDDVMRLQYSGRPLTWGSGNLRVGGNTAAEAMVLAKDTALVGGANTVLDVVRAAGKGGLGGPVGFGAAAIIDWGSGDKGEALADVLALGASFLPCVGRASSGPRRGAAAAPKTGAKTVAKTVEDFLPQAEKQLKEIQASRPGMEGVKGMAKKPDIRFIDSLEKELKLSKAQRDLLHDAITGQNLTKQEIREVAQEIKELYPNK
jgi:hypothetical protein